ncbi:hypothetical protein PED39_03035 [Methanomassiliicoccales archaeon LGM-RCC1]|nr:hypothetical protein PED39_03035 [Methanomassiliicoccales archaeon LGM-RCC1]
MLDASLNKITPQKVRMYLSSRKWEKQRGEQKFDVYSNPSFDEDLIVPNDNSYSDYSKRIKELISDLSRLYDEKPDLITAGLTISTFTDVVEYHYEPSGGEVGLIPIPDLRNILKAGENLNKFGLRDALDFQPFYKGRGKYDKCLDAVRVGPTIPGSYIVQFIYPGLESKSYMESTVDGEIKMDNPNLRILCDKIETSISAIIDAAERGKSSLDQELKISYNFVDSLMDLRFESAEIDIQRYKTLNTDVQPKPMNLSKGVFRNIERIDKEMRPDFMSEQCTIIGRLVQLNDIRENSKGEPITMKIKYMNDDNNKVYTAKFQVDPEDVDTAYDASRTRKMVSITGTIVGLSNSRRIEDISDFKIVS